MRSTASAGSSVLHTMGDACSPTTGGGSSQGCFGRRRGGREDVATGASIGAASRRCPERIRKKTRRPNGFHADASHAALKSFGHGTPRPGWLDRGDAPDARSLIELQVKGDTALWLLIQLDSKESHAPVTTRGGGDGADSTLPSIGFVPRRRGRNLQGSKVSPCANKARAQNKRA